MIFKRNFPRVQRTILTDFEQIRELGGALYPEPAPGCCDLTPLPKELDSLQGVIEQAVSVGVSRALRDAPPQVTTNAPNNSPPFRSIPLNRFTNLIVGGTTAPGFLEIQQGLVGIQGFSPTYPITKTAIQGQGAGFVDQQAIQAPVFTYTPHDRERVHICGIKTIGASSIDAYTSLVFTLLVGGRVVLDSLQLLDMEDISVEAGPRQTIQLVAYCKQDQATFLVMLHTCGWRYPSQGQGNYLSQAVLKEDGGWHADPRACAPCPPGPILVGRNGVTP